MKALLLLTFTGVAFGSSLSSLPPFKDLSASTQQLLIETATRIGLGNKPVAELPESIKPTDAKFSLVADYEHAANARIPVYLINQSGDVVSLGAEDRDVYLELEFQDTDGEWKRAQTHNFSWCGNSYMFEPPLKDQHFIALSGYQPKSGSKARIRYRLYRQLFEAVSNVGEGIIDPAEVEAARHDRMVVLGAPFEYLAALAQGKVPEPDLGRWSGGELAIFELTERGFDPARVEEVLNAIAIGEGPYTGAARTALKQIAAQRERQTRRQR